MRHGKVYTDVIESCSKGTILALLLGRIDRRSVIHSDGVASYDGLADMGCKKHLRVDHSANQFSRRAIRGDHINGRRSARSGFWGSAKTRTDMFRSKHPHTF